MSKQQIVLLHNIPSEDVEPIYSDLLHYLDKHWAPCSVCGHYFKRSDYQIKKCKECRKANNERNGNLGKNQDGN